MKRLTEKVAIAFALLMLATIPVAVGAEVLGHKDFVSMMDCNTHSKVQA
ncbi:MAG: hypothetical protein HC851_23035 [Acaryochloris sp. RU_4_1]|nr:hypothetical protein [Acaryochloris sp. RU_4_1]NJR57060.1 hypothetical protein [Acaryochloris sp. CRU_2_0]